MTMIFRQSLAPRDALRAALGGYYRADEGRVVAEILDAARMAPDTTAYLTNALSPSNAT